MRVLVCGGREYAGDVTCLSMIDISILIHGGARGADIRAGEWATSLGIPTASVPANWNFYKKAAGYRRNASMLLLQPEYCVAFPGGDGTQMMVDLCEKKGVPVWRPYGC